MRLAQISIFLIISIILIVGFVFLIFFNFSFEKDSIDDFKTLQNNMNNPEVVAVKSYIDSCLESEANFGLELAIMHNSKFDEDNYLIIPEEPTLLNLDFYYENYNREEIEFKYLEKFVIEYLENQLLPCLVYNWPFYNESFQIKMGSNPKFDASIDFDSMRVEMFFDVIIKSNLDIYELSYFDYNLNKVPIETLRNDINELTSQIQNLAIEERNSFPEDYLENLKNREDVGIIGFEDVNGWHLMISYSPEYWHDINYRFRIKSNTQK